MDNGSSGEYTCTCTWPGSSGEYTCTCTWPPKLGWIMGVLVSIHVHVHDLLN